MPKYKQGKCCESGRVGKDLLCGVVIAVGVICVAVSIFLVAYFIINGIPSIKIKIGSIKIRRLDQNLGYILVDLVEMLAF